MKFFSFSIMHLFLLQFFVIIYFVSATPNVPKRQASFYITPSLRVGRRSRWGTLNSDIKRYGKLMAFPRVGRGGDKSWQTDGDSYAKRAGGAKTGMWFGPRLGRIQKRNIAFDNASPWTYIIYNDVPFTQKYPFNTQQLDGDAEVQLDQDDFNKDLNKDIPLTLEEQPQ